MVEQAHKDALRERAAASAQLQEAHATISETRAMLAEERGKNTKVRFILRQTFPFILKQFKQLRHMSPELCLLLPLFQNCDRLSVSSHSTPRFLRTQVEEKLLESGNELRRKATQIQTLETESDGLRGKLDKTLGELQAAQEATRAGELKVARLTSQVKNAEESAEEARAQCERLREELDRALKGANAEVKAAGTGPLPRSASRSPTRRRSHGDPSPGAASPQSPKGSAEDIKRRVALQQEDLDARAKELEAREAAIDERLRVREEEHAARLAASAQAHEQHLYEQSQRAAETASAAAAQTAAEHAAAIAEREEAVVAAEAEINRRQEDVAREGERTIDLMKRTESDAKLLAEQRRAIERREKLLEKAEAAMVAQKRRLDRRESELNARSSGLDLHPTSPTDSRGGEGEAEPLSPFMPVLKALSPRLKVAATYVAEISPNLHAATKSISPVLKKARDAASGLFITGPTEEDANGREGKLTAVASTPSRSMSAKRRRVNADDDTVEEDKNQLPRTNKKRKSLGAAVLSVLRSAMGYQEEEDELSGEDESEDEDGGVDVAGKLDGAFAEVAAGSGAAQKWRRGDSKSGGATTTEPASVERGTPLALRRLYSSPMRYHSMKKSSPGFVRTPQSYAGEGASAEAVPSSSKGSKSKKAPSQKAQPNSSSAKKASKKRPAAAADTTGESSKAVSDARKAADETAIAQVVQKGRKTGGRNRAEATAAVAKALTSGEDDDDGGSIAAAGSKSTAAVTKQPPSRTTKGRGNMKSSSQLVDQTTNEAAATTKRPARAVKAPATEAVPLRRSTRVTRSSAKRY